MCGIVGYVGKEKSLPILISGLKALEYRGYDSAGVAIFVNDKVKVKKSVGQVKILEKSLESDTTLDSHLGIGHTRWATHGVPNMINAHPHQDCQNRVFIVHNGIIENYKELKEYLKKRGHNFTSDTDTEVIPHLIEDFLKNKCEFRTALLNTLKMIKGAYALAIIDSQNPHTLYAVSFSSPLVIGVGKDENFLASDHSALIGKTKDVIYLKDGEIAEITKDNINLTNFEKEKTSPEIVRLEYDLEQAQKGSYPHFMLKEIFGRSRDCTFRIAGTNK